MSKHNKVKRLTNTRAQTAHSYFSFGGSETPVPLPPLPSWMLDTPMHGKLPMIPAPKGKIILYTTGLCQKLHHILSDLDFDPNPQELSTEYKSLHDKHLKSYYRHPSVLSRLIRNGFITPEGKIICTLKEFNDYQQHLKRVRLEKLTQDRKRKNVEERQERERMRRTRSKTMEQLARERRADEAQKRKKKALKERQMKLTKRQNDCALRHLHLMEERRQTQEMEEASKKQEQERIRHHKMQSEKEERHKKACYLRQRAKEERKRAAKLEKRRIETKEAREKRLEEQWDRKCRFQELRGAQEQLEKERAYEKMETNIDVREKAAEAQFLKQQAAYSQIRDARAKEAAEKEEQVSRHLEKKRTKLQSQFDRKRKRRSAKHKAVTVPPRHMQAMHHHTLRTSTWEIYACLLSSDFYGDKTDEEVSKSSSGSSVRKHSSQDLPVVSSPGSGRALSWHESMSDLSSKEKLPPIGSKVFEDEDLVYGSHTPEQSTSEEISQPVVSVSSESRSSEASPCQCLSTPDADAVHVPAIEIQLEEQEQSGSLEFTQDEFDHFMGMASSDEAQIPSASVQDMDHEISSQVEDHDRPERVDVTKSVAVTILRKAFTFIFKCSESSDTLSLSESDLGLLETSVSAIKSQVSETGAALPQIDSKATEMSRTETAESVLLGVIDDDSETSFGIAADQEAIEREESRADLTATSKACTIVENAIRGAMSTLTTPVDSVEWGDFLKTEEVTESTSSMKVEISSDEGRRGSILSGSSVAATSAEGSEGYFELDDTIQSNQGDDIKDILSSEEVEIEKVLEEEDSETSGEEESGYALDRESSSLLRSLIDVFGESPVNTGELRSASEEEGEESEEDEEEEEVIGFLENPTMVEETGISTVMECVASQEQPFTEIFSISDENRMRVEGAIRRASSGDFVGQKGSITEAVLSIQNLTKTTSSKLVREKVSGKPASSDGDNDDANAPFEAKFEPEEHYHQIIPIYHNHSIDVGEDLIENNLSAISIKPDSHKNIPHAHQTASRNSFRNIFRPDMTYCEGSARCLKSSLVNQISHHSASSSSSSHAHMMSLLEQSHHDVTAKHSHEEIVTTDEAEGVCHWPKRRTFKVHHVIEDVVKEQDESSDKTKADTTEEGKMNESDTKATDQDRKVELSDTSNDFKGETSEHSPEIKNEDKKDGSKAKTSDEDDNQDTAVSTEDKANSNTNESQTSASLEDKTRAAIAEGQSHTAGADDHIQGTPPADAPEDQPKQTSTMTAKDKSSQETEAGQIQATNDDKAEKQLTETGSEDQTNALAAENQIHETDKKSPEVICEIEDTNSMDMQNEESKTESQNTNVSSRLLADQAAQEDCIDDNVNTNPNQNKNRSTDVDDKINKQVSETHTGSVLIKVSAKRSSALSTSSQDGAKDDDSDAVVDLKEANQDGAGESVDLRDDQNEADIETSQLEGRADVQSDTSDKSIQQNENIDGQGCNDDVSFSEIQPGTIANTESEGKEDIEMPTGDPFCSTSTQIAEKKKRKHKDHPPDSIYSGTSNATCHGKDTVTIKHAQSDTSGRRRRRRHSSDRSVNQLRKSCSSIGKPPPGRSSSSRGNADKETKTDGSSSTKRKSNQCKQMLSKEEQSEDIHQGEDSLTAKLSHGSSKKCSRNTNENAKGSRREKTKIETRVKRSGSGKRSIGTSRSATGGNRRSSNSRPIQIAQSKSANAPSQSKKKLMEIQPHNSRTCTENHENLASSCTNSGCAITSRSSHDIKPTRSKATLDSDNNKPLPAKKQHSVILVQPVKEKRSSCTVILTSKRSSQLNMRERSTSKDLETPVIKGQEQQDHPDTKDMKALDEKRLPVDDTAKMANGAEESIPLSRDKSAEPTIEKEGSGSNVNTAPPKEYVTDTAAISAKEPPSPLSHRLDPTETIQARSSSEKLAAHTSASSTEHFGRRHPSRIRLAKSLSSGSTFGIGSKKKLKKGSSDKVSDDDMTGSSGSTPPKLSASTSEEDQTIRKSSQTSQLGKKKSGIIDVVVKSIGSLVSVGKKRSSGFEATDNVVQIDDQILSGVEDAKGRIETALQKITRKDVSETNVSPKETSNNGSRTSSDDLIP